MSKPFVASPKELDRFAQRKRASLGQVLLRAARLFNERALERVRTSRSAPIRLSHTRLLPYIDLDGTRLSDLALRAGISKQATGQMVDSLEALGLLERRPDPDDARARRVHFTRKGFEALHRGLGVLEELEAEVSQQLEPRALAALRKHLPELLRVLEHLGPVPHRPPDGPLGVQRWK